MATTNYVERLIEDIIKKSDNKSIRFNEPVHMDVEIRTDSDYYIDFEMSKIAIDRFSVKKNIFGDYKILVANGKHNITFLTEESYNEIKRQIK